MFLDNLGNNTEFKTPSRKPWVFIVIIAVLGVVCYQSYQLIKKPKSGGNAAPVDTIPVVPTNIIQSVRVQQTNDTWILVVNEAKALETANKWELARHKYLSLLADCSDKSIIDIAEKELGRVSTIIMFSTVLTPEKITYTVKPGDSLEKIAKAHGATVNQIRRANGMSEARILRAGESIVFTKAVFTVECSKSANDMALYMNKNFFKRYKVCTGKMGKTPEGTFVINDKIVEPPWWRGDKMVPFGDKENILGTRWMSIKATGNTKDVKGYGIHGTWNDASIGTADSAGCIRMHNADVEELFDILPLGTKVDIKP